MDNMRHSTYNQGAKEAIDCELLSATDCCFLYSSSPLWMLNQI
uniref:Uncharacterized protein n=1 Tax=Vitis vinifera TaxID=29760 RepID=F6I6R3_VITVI